MTIRDLILELRKLDPNARVDVEHEHHGTWIGVVTGSFSSDVDENGVPIAVLTVAPRESNRK